MQFDGLHKKFEAIWHNFSPFVPVRRALYVRRASVNFTLETLSQCVALSLCVTLFSRQLLEAFPMSKLGAG